MENIIVIIVLAGLVGLVVGLVWLIYSFVKKKEKKTPGIILGVSAVCVVVGALAMPTDESSASGEAETSSSVEDADLGIDDSDEDTEETEEAEDETTNELSDYEDVDYDNVDTSDYSEIPYDDLARNPEDYEGDLVTLTGTVIQVIEDDDYPEYRLAVDDDYDDIILIEIPSELIDSRILEDDVLTVYGESAGVLDYESTSGEQVTVPAVAVHKYETQ